MPPHLPRDSVHFTAALVLGAVLGASLTLLFRGEERRRTGGRRRRGP